MSTVRDHYGDGVWYDAEYVHVGADIPAYREWARRVGGPILELACGTGRLTLALSEVGARVLGIDLSPAMIARAEDKRRALAADHRGRVEFRIGDMRTVEVGERFAAVLIGLNSLMHMTSDLDLQAALATAHRHLRPDGILALDVFMPPPAAYGRDPDARFDPQEMIDPRNGRRYRVTESTRYEPARQIHHLSFHYQPVDRAGRPDGPEQRSELEVRVVFPRELELWLEIAGFEIVGDWDDLAASVPFSGTGGRRFVEARPAATRKLRPLQPPLAPILPGD